MSRAMKTRDITEVEFEKVSEDYKKKLNYYKYVENPVIKLLIDEKAVIKVPLDTRTYKLDRYLKTKGLVLKKRKIENAIILWIEQTPSEEDYSENSSENND